jgi:hypothetical protein
MAHKRKLKKCTIKAPIGIVKFVIGTFGGNALNRSFRK